MKLTIETVNVDVAKACIAIVENPNILIAIANLKKSATELIQQQLCPEPCGLRGCPICRAKRKTIKALAKLQL